MFAIIAYTLFALFFLVDMYIDLMEHVPLSHVWHEVFLFFLAVGAATWQIFVIYKKNNQIKLISKELLETKKSYLEWKEKSKSSANEIRDMIDNQLNIWHLSHSEKDVALFLIKGLSMKEIADIRRTQEKTVRQQATTIYRKAALSGRQELAAFFLEDIISAP